MAHPFDLSDKKAVVTGGNGGIGLAMAEALARAGAAVCIWGTSEEKNKAAVERLRASGSDGYALRCDVSDADAVAAAFSKSLDLLGGADACFANAGVGPVGTRFTEMSLEEWRRIFQVNLEGAFLTFQAAVHHMVDRGRGGSLVITSSAATRFGFARGEHYAATKAGAEALVRGLAVEYGKEGIRANAVLPGWVETAMTEGLFASQPFRERVLPRIPLRRWGTPADYGAIAVYLASDASAWHTGDVITIDGGYSVF